MPHKLVGKTSFRWQWYLAIQRENADFTIAYYTFQSFPLSASTDGYQILSQDI